jgi:hypothetical protein
LFGRFQERKKIVDIHVIGVTAELLLFFGLEIWILGGISPFPRSVVNECWPGRSGWSFT